MKEYQCFKAIILLDTIDIVMPLYLYHTVASNVKSNNIIYVVMVARELKESSCGVSNGMRNDDAIFGNPLYIKAHTSEPEIVLIESSL